MSKDYEATSSQNGDGRDITALASRWNSGVNVSVSRPTTVVRGPVRTSAGKVSAAAAYKVSDKRK